MGWWYQCYDNSFPSLEQMMSTLLQPLMTGLSNSGEESRLFKMFVFPCHL